jgi:erythromycin esterase-like protein
LLKSNEWLYNIYTGKKNNRDKDLAENLLWVKDCYNSKVAIWAHTSHIQNNPAFYGENQGSMGYYLRESLQENYLIVSTAFTKGKFKAVMEGPNGDTPPLDCEIVENPLPESINEIFHQAKSEIFSLDVSKIQQSSKLYSYLDTVRPMLGIGDCFAGSIKPHYHSPERKINLLKATDLVFYFSDTHPVRVHNRFNEDLKNAKLLLDL